MSKLINLENLFFSPICVVISYSVENIYRVIYLVLNKNKIKCPKPSCVTKLLGFDM